MSKGPGAVMRAALEAVRQATRPVESQEVARQVFERDRLEDVTPAESASVRRALRTLAQRGEVEDLGRDWSRKRRKWATPEGAAAHREQVRAFLEYCEARRRERRAGASASPDFAGVLAVLRGSK